MPGLWSQASHNCLLIAQLLNSHLGPACLHVLPPEVGGVLAPLPGVLVRGVPDPALLLLLPAAELQVHGCPWPALPLLGTALLFWPPLGGDGVLAHPLCLGLPLLSAHPSFLLSQN